MTTPSYERSIPALTEFEFRTDGATPRFTGYSAVFNSDSEDMGFVETIQPGAFAGSLKSDTRNHTFVVDHDDTKLLASRRAKTLTLSEDSRGLLVEAELPNTSYARDLVELHERGEARSMSFTFRPTKGGDMWSDDRKRRTLTNVRLGHVTILTGLAPAYRQTTASIRSLANELGCEADELNDALEAIRDGQPLDARAVELLSSVIDARREAPAVVEAVLVTVPTRQWRLALASKAR